jgi:hypothetical protein
MNIIDLTPKLVEKQNKDALNSIIDKGISGAIKLNPFSNNEVAALTCLAQILRGKKDETN